jgi:cytosine/creatinine deaminase
MSTGVVPRFPGGFLSLPEDATYVLVNCSVPGACLNSSTEHDSAENPDKLVRCDILVSNGVIREIGSLSGSDTHPTVDLEGGLCFPTFVDLHTHIGTSQLPRRINEFA